jgi:hypothetical protein
MLEWCCRTRVRFPPPPLIKELTMDYQNKKKFRKSQKKKNAKQNKVKLRRAAIQEENRVERLLAKMRYDSRQKIRPYKKEID